MTVNQLLTGVPSPLSNAEFVEWAAFYAVRASKQQRASKHSSARKRR